MASSQYPVRPSTAHPAVHPAARPHALEVRPDGRIRVDPRGCVNGPAGEAGKAFCVAGVVFLLLDAFFG